jgi:hypothetical protein
MKILTLLIILAMASILLSACGGSTPAMPTEEQVINVPVPVSTESIPTSTPTELVINQKIPAASFESQTYVNETAGFAMDYPAQWTMTETVIGPRGTQVLFLSSPEIADLPKVSEGATRVSANIYLWEPKNDLPAYIAHLKTAWDASGFTILNEEEMTLDLGLHAVQFVVQTPDANVVFLVSAVRDQYLVVSGEGDLGLVQEITRTLRPISAQ